MEIKMGHAYWRAKIEADGGPRKTSLELAGIAASFPAMVRAAEEAALERKPKRPNFPILKEWGGYNRETTQVVCDNVGQPLPYCHLEWYPLVEEGINNSSFPLAFFRAEIGYHIVRCDSGKNGNFANLVIFQVTRIEGNDVYAKAVTDPEEAIFSSAIKALKSRLLSGERLVQKPYFNGFCMPAFYQEAGSVENCPRGNSSQPTDEEVAKAKDKEEIEASLSNLEYSLESGQRAILYSFGMEVSRDEAGPFYSVSEAEKINYSEVLINSLSGEIVCPTGGTINNHYSRSGLYVHSRPKHYLDDALKEYSFDPRKVERAWVKDR